ncbi:MAG TPA: polysaccharide deacetylase family protein [Blastocatellia bacterium]|nr:polysaccharide deacetylase family protein [Blastocatellia bacterium]
MKQAMLNLMKATGVFAPFRFANRDRSLIVTYHRFGSNDAMKMSARDFRAQIDYLTSRYEIVPLSLIADRIADKRRLAAITIDDGYSDAYEIAFPILREYSVPATLFATTDFIDRKIWMWTDKLRYLTSRAQNELLETTIGNRALRLTLNGSGSRERAAERINNALKSISEDDKNRAIDQIAESLCVEIPDVPPDDLGPITWEQAREMDAAAIEIGSHTVTHPILTNVSRAQLRSELVQSRERIESILKRKVDLFCYPNGDYNSEVTSEVERAGYRCAVTVEPGLNDAHSSPFALRRIAADSDLAHFVQSTSGFEQVKAGFYGVRAKGIRATGL